MCTYIINKPRGRENIRNFTYHFPSFLRGKERRRERKVGSDLGYKLRKERNMIILLK